jgi:ribosomal protein L28
MRRIPHGPTTAGGRDPASCWRAARELMGVLQIENDPGHPGEGHASKANSRRWQINVASKRRWVARGAERTLHAGAKSTRERAISAAFLVATLAKIRPSLAMRRFDSR